MLNRPSLRSCLGRRVSLVRIQSPRPLFEFRGSSGVPHPSGTPGRHPPVVHHCPDSAVQLTSCGSRFNCQTTYPPPSRNSGTTCLGSLEAIAVEAYRTGALTDSQVRRLLGFESRFQVHALLKEHHVPLQYTSADIEDDLRAQRELGILPGR